MYFVLNFLINRYQLLILEYMEIKKNPEADLERRSGLFLNIGLCISLILVIAAFEWRSYDRGAAMDLGSLMTTSRI